MSHFENEPHFAENFFATFNPVLVQPLYFRELVYQYQNILTTFEEKWPRCCSTLDLNLCGIGITSLNNRHRKVLHEVGQRAQLARKHKVEQRPQLFQVVLHRASRQNYAVTRSKLQRPRNNKQHLPQLILN